jgi:hypothetical protein
MCAMSDEIKKFKEGPESPEYSKCPYNHRCLDEGSDHVKFLKKSSWQANPECLREDAKTCGRSFCYGNLRFCKCLYMQEKLKPEY